MPAERVARRISLRSRRSYSVAAITVSVALVATACSHAKLAANSSSTTLSPARTSTTRARSTSTTLSSFPSVVKAAFSSVGSTSAPLIAPRYIPLPAADSGKSLSATVSSTHTGWTVDLYVTPAALAVNDPSLSHPPYRTSDGQPGPAFLGSFGASESSGSDTAATSMQTQAADLDSDCRSQLVGATIGSGITGQTCSNGTGTTYLWSEGNWRIGVVASNSLGPPDTTLPAKIASFLHSHYLPPPSDVGVISARALGGPSPNDPSASTPVATSVTVTWSVGPVIVSFTDALDAMGGLQMVLSQASY